MTTRLGSFAQVGAPVGVILANLAFLLMSASTQPDEFMQWGWRVPFLVSVVLIGLALFVQLRLEDTVEFLKVQKTRAPWICVSLAVGQMLVAMMYGPQAAFVAEMFNTEVRYSGASLGYQLGAILGGGFAPIIATALLAEYQDTVGISTYMAIACAITLWSTWLLGETAGARAATSTAA